MTEQQEPSIANEAVFLQTLGVNPSNVRAGSVHVEFMQGQPVISFTSIHPVTPRALGLAFLASGAQEEAPAEEEKKPARQRRQPADRQPAKKAAPRKKAQS